MVTAVTTSTSATATAAFNGRHLDRCQDGTLWEIHEHTGATASAAGTSGSELRFSKDNGATWTTYTFGSGYTIMQGARNASIFIDLDDYIHVVFKNSVATTADGIVGSPNNSARASGHLSYLRGTPNAGRTAWTWSTAVGLVSQLGWDVPDVVAARRSGGGWDAFVVLSYDSGIDNAVGYTRIPITAAGAIGTPVIDGLTQVATAGSGKPVGILGTYSVAAHTYPSIDFNHTGDGKTVAGGTPHLYVGWNAGVGGAGKGIRFRKAVYSGGAWTWNPEREIDNDRYPEVNNGAHWQTTHFDGTRACIVSWGRRQFDGQNRITVYDRDAADTTTTVNVVAVLTGTDSVNYGSASYDQAGNVYVFGRSGSVPQIVAFRKWARATGTASPFTTIDSTSVGVPYVSAKRGSQPGNSIEIVYTDGTSSPYTVQYDRTVPDVDAPATPYVPRIML